MVYSDSLGVDHIFFFCKQKTAYEMRISDWSSGVCSSDLTIEIDAPIIGVGERFRVACADHALKACLPRRSNLSFERRRDGSRLRPDIRIATGGEAPVGGRELDTALILSIADITIDLERQPVSKVLQAGRDDAVLCMSVQQRFRNETVRGG